MVTGIAIPVSYYINTMKGNEGQKGVQGVETHLQVERMEPRHGNCCWGHWGGGCACVGAQSTGDSVYGQSTKEEGARMREKAGLEVPGSGNGGNSPAWQMAKGSQLQGSTEPWPQSGVWDVSQQRQST